MKTVLKYPVAVTDNFTQMLPRGAEILHVAEQHPNNVFMWALIEPTAPEELRTFRLAGTGHTILQNVKGKHVATFFMRGGQLVFHLFDVTRTR